MRETLLSAFENRVSLPGSSTRSDFDLNPGTTFLREESVRPAAVLVPIVAHAGAPTVLLTRRSAELKQHAGQVSFPGGRIDPEDENAVAAALRETEEETGISRRYVDVIGTLDQYRTVTHFMITPVVALVTPGFKPIAEPGEVDEIFEVPLSFVLDRGNHRREQANWKGETRHYYAMPYGSYNIWGATAAMLVNLVDVLEPVMTPEKAG